MGCGCTEREKPILDVEATPDPEKDPVPAKRKKKPAGKAAKSDTTEKVSKLKSPVEPPPSDKPSNRKSAKASPDPPSRKSTRKQTVATQQKEPIKRLADPFASLYTASDSIFTGEKFTVVKGVFVASQQECVLKLLPKKKDGKLQKDNQQNAELAAVWMKVGHPQLPRIHDVMQDEASFYVASEPLTGLSLTAYLAKCVTLTEKQAAAILFQLLALLQTAHALNLTHQKLTPDSIIILQEAESPQVKVACPADLDGRLEATAIRFSPFIAPEVPNAGFTPASDIWACGVILYYMLSGCSPFTQEQYSEFAQATKKPKIEFPPQQWKAISITAKTLISLMLAKDPIARLSAPQCQANEWVQANRPKLDVTAKSLRRTLTNLKNVKAVTPLKAAILKFMIARVMPGSEIATMATTFSHLDADGNGTLTSEEIVRGLRQTMPSDKAEEAKNQIMAFADKDGSGMISYNEFLLSAINEKEMLSVDNLSKAFRTLDRDGSNSITVTELKRSLFENSTPEKEKLWRSMTSNLSILDDGQITFPEFEGLMRKACASKRP